MARVALALPLVLLMGFALTTTAHAQTKGPILRVMHLWVDPHYGNDTQATNFNPGGSAQCVPGVELFPNDVQDPNQGNAVLLHDSWPFRTITAAINALPSAGLPYTSPYTGVTWSYAIIHVMPGIISQGSGNYDSNGYPYNGETFPIVLPRYVSIQGTSALDTVFYNQFVTGNQPTFRFGTMTSRGPADGTGTFIDGVSMFGAAADSMADPPEAGAAIHIDTDVASHPTMSNCFLFGNQIGVMVENSPDGMCCVHDGVTLINNTIAWNTIGVWNGSQVGAPPATGTGFGLLNLINNIFDATPPSTACPRGWLPTGWTAQGVSGFEGIDTTDMFLTAPSVGNFNAYEWWPGQAPNGKFNFGTPILPNLSRVVPRTAGPGAPATGRNIALFTGWRGAGQAVLRGTLYIRDLFCNGMRVGQFQVARQNFDGSPHDFRLSPGAAPAQNGTPQPAGSTAGANPAQLNPLVDNGFSVSFPATITLANGQTLSNPPGYLPLSASQATWPYHTWEWDCEGFGNPRIHNHIVFGDAGVGGIDIGADELGELILAGYRFGTRTFAHIVNSGNLPGNTQQMDNICLWFINVSNGTNGLTTLPAYVLRPMHRDLTNLTGPMPPWPDPNLNPNPPTTPPPGYPIHTWHRQWAFQVGIPLAYYNATLADISPHLQPDVHPWWGYWLTSGLGSWPNWRYCDYPAGIYNTLLYWNPTIGRINPPGAFLPAGPGVAQWIDTTNSPPTKPIQIATFRPTVAPGAGYGGGPSTLILYDDWLRGGLASGQRYDVMHVTSRFLTPMVAVRFSVETLDSATLLSRGTYTANLPGNLQTFAVIVEPTLQ